MKPALELADGVGLELVAEGGVAETLRVVGVMVALVDTNVGIVIHEDELSTIVLNGAEATDGVLLHVEELFAMLLLEMDEVPTEAVFHADRLSMVVSLPEDELVGLVMTALLMLEVAIGLGRGRVVLFKLGVCQRLSLLELSQPSLQQQRPLNWGAVCAEITNSATRLKSRRNIFSKD